MQQEKTVGCREAFPSKGFTCLWKQISSKYNSCGRQLFEYKKKCQVKSSKFCEYYKILVYFQNKQAVFIQLDIC